MGQWQSFADKDPSAGDTLGTNEAICGCLKVMLYIAALFLYMCGSEHDIACSNQPDLECLASVHLHLKSV